MRDFKARSINMCYMYIHIYIYIYIHTHIERERYVISLSIYIYIYMCILVLNTLKRPEALARLQGGPAALRNIIVGSA